MLCFFLKFPEESFTLCVLFLIITLCKIFFFSISKSYFSSSTFFFCFIKFFSEFFFLGKYLFLSSSKAICFSPARRFLFENVSCSRRICFSSLNSFFLQRISLEEIFSAPQLIPFNLCCFSYQHLFHLLLISQLIIQTRSLQNLTLIPDLLYNSLH